VAETDGAGTRRVLIVDNDEHVREAISVVVSDMGLEPVAVAGGREALAWLARGKRPALILLDLNMPGMSGWDFRAAQEHDDALARIPVVVLTARGDATAQGHRLRAAGAIEKPIELDQLRQTVMEHLAS